MWNITFAISLQEVDILFFPFNNIQQFDSVFLSLVTINIFFEKCAKRFGRGGSDEPDLPAEFTDYQYKRGTIGMARTQNPNSANSQFFICFTDTGCSFLTGQYTVWGQVTEGMEFVDKIALGEPPANPDKIIKAFVGSDVAEEAPAEEAPAEAITEEAPAETDSEAAAQ